MLNGRLFLTQSQLFRYVFPRDYIAQSINIEGLSAGPSYCGYDIRIAESIELKPNEFKLASALEYFQMPITYRARVMDKSTWARCGLSVQNTLIEPGWRGYLTLELHNMGDSELIIPIGSPIAQVVFESAGFWFSRLFSRGYAGKYQDQQKGPQPARYL